MSDLIERDKAIEAIENVDWYHQNRSKDMVSGANDDEHQAWYKADDIYKVLETIPSARPKDEWIARRPSEKGLGVVYECPFCEYEVDCVPTNFCPNCGADMRGK